MATVLEEYTTEEKRSVVCFLWSKGLNATDIRKEYLLFTGESVCRVKLFTAGWQNFADDEEVKTEVGKWLRQ
jgi:hypothetical protein